MSGGAWTRDWPYYHADPTNPPPYLEREVCPAAASEGMKGTRRLLEADFFRPLQKQAIPTPVLGGEKGPFPLWAFEETQALIPGAVATVLPDAGHYPW